MRVYVGKFMRREQATNIRKLSSRITSAAAFVVLFVLVLVGTLSVAFDIEDNLQQSGIIQNNVADAGYSSDITVSAVGRYTRNKGDKIGDTEWSSLGNEVSLASADKTATWKYHTKKKTLSSSWNEADGTLEYTYNTRTLTYTQSSETKASFVAAFDYSFTNTSSTTKKYIVVNYTLTVASNSDGAKNTIMGVAAYEGKSASSITYKANDSEDDSNDANHWGGTVSDANTVVEKKGTVASSSSSATVYFEIAPSSAQHITFVFGRNASGTANSNIVYTVQINSIDVLSGDGSETSKYQLKNRTDFDIVSHFTNSGVDFAGQYFEVSPDKSNSQNDFINMTSAAFTPIGNGSNAFKGNVDGNDKQIKNLNVRGGDYAGLFGHIEDGTIENIKLDGASVEGRTYTGGIVGYSKNATINNCSVSGVIGIGGKLSGSSNGYSIVQYDGHEPESDEGFANINDGNSGTKFYTDKNTASFIVELTDPKTIVSGFAFITGDDDHKDGSKYRRPQGVKIYGSNTNNQTTSYKGSGNAGNVPSDGDWEEIYSNASLDIPQQSYYRKSFSLNGTATYKYYWVYVISYAAVVDGATAGMQFSEFELLTAKNVGGIVGSSNGSSTLISCENSATVCGADCVGGIVGFAERGTRLYGTMTNSASIVGGGMTGGIGGEVHSLLCDTSSNYGTFSNSGTITAPQGSSVGGCFGFTDKELRNASNTADVIGGCDVGGIVGRSQAPIKKSHNTGNVKGTIAHQLGSGEASATPTGTFVGGIVGYTSTTCTVSNCYNKGNVSATNSSGEYFDNANYVGGIVGYAQANVTYCASIESTVDGNDYLGGIVGSTTATVDYCYSVSGAINYRYSDARIGAIAAQGGTISNSWQIYKTAVTYSCDSANASDSGLGRVFSKDSTISSVVPIVISGSSYSTKTWENITDNNINGVEVVATIGTNKYFVSRKGENGKYLQPTRISSQGTPSPTSVTADYSATTASDVYVGTQDITQTTAGTGKIYNTKGETWDISFLAQPGSDLNNESPVVYTATFTTPTINANVGSYSTEVKLYINGVLVGRKETLTYTISQKTVNDSAFTATFSQTYVYNRVAQTPKPAIKWTAQDVTLVESTDFTYSWANNVNAGTASVTITGKGNYKDSKTFNFTIEQKNVNDSDFTADFKGATYIYNRAEQKPEPTINWTSKSYALVKGTEFDFRYENNVNAGVNTAKVIIDGKGNYKGTKIFTFTINPKNISNASEFRITVTSSHEYNATSQTPTYKVEWISGGSVWYTLQKNTEYTDNVSAATSAGTHSFTVSGKGNYTGSQTTSFTIERFDITKAGAVWFGAGPNMLVGNQTLDTSVFSSGYYQLQSSEGEQPNVLVYQTTAYNKDNFVLYVRFNNNNVVALDLGDEYDLTWGNNSATIIGAGSEHVAKTSVNAAAKGNLKGSLKRYYTVLDSDFGGNITSANWGSKTNPYVIKYPEQLLQLSLIVNGGKAINSIKGTLSLAPQSTAYASGRSYYGCYFRIDADIVAPSQGTSKTKGFEPIGKSGSSFMATSFGSSDDNVFMITYSYDNASTDYVGLFGYIVGTRIYNINVATTASGVHGHNYVGGIVGYATSVTIENCAFRVITNGANSISGNNYVGGIIGEGNATTIKYTRTGNEGFVDLSTAMMQANVSGVDYVGGIAGKWRISNASQHNGDDNGKAQALGYAQTNLVIESTGKYVGGLVGWLDASSCSSLTIAPTYTNGTSYMTVKGVSYAGVLYGVFQGGGYYKEKNQTNNSYIVIKSATVNGEEIPLVSASLQISGSGNVVGGLVGFMSGAALLFNTDWNSGEQITMTFADATNIVGSIVGMLGENATIESATQTTDGSYVAGGAKTIQNTVQLGSSTKRLGNFVGGIVGYVAASAGTYSVATGTIFLNAITLKNSAQIYAANMVGGIIGGAGIVSSPKSYGVSSTDFMLYNYLIYGQNSSTTYSRVLGIANLESTANVSSPFGKTLNLANVNASNEYVGGIIGYAGASVRLALKNNQSNSLTAYANLSVFNGSCDDNNDVTISGAKYVGGIAGYLATEKHTMSFVVNNARVVGTTEYVGGLVGRMESGTISGSISLTNQTVTSSTSRYVGTNYVGGLVGYTHNGEIFDSISTGFDFSTTSDTRGGVLGYGVNPTIENSWTIYVAQSGSDYSDISKNDRGSYVAVDDACDVNLTYEELALATSLKTDSSQDSIQGKLCFKLNVPGNNQQLVFYAADGNDAVTTNTVDSGMLGFNSHNNTVTITLALDADSMLAYATDIKFVNVKAYTTGSQTSGEANAEESYRHPSNATSLYVPQVTKAEYNGPNNAVSLIQANIYYDWNGALVLVGSATQTANKDGYLIGSYNKTFTAGSSADTPITISTQAEWDEFAWLIYTGQNDFNGQYIKLLAENIRVYYSASHNGHNFASETTPNASSSDTKNATSNLGYNFAGNIAQGAESMANVTVSGVDYTGINKVTPSFKGIFDGNGKTITISVGETTAVVANRISVFPNAQSATFKNLTIAGVINTYDNSAGTTTNNKIYYNAGSHLAGFVGKPFGRLTFNNCVSATNITGYSVIAGIAGYSTSSATISMTACVNKGNITSLEGSQWIKETGQNIGYPKMFTYGTGGLVAYATSSITIDSCLNTGDVIGKANVGGLIGSVSGTSSSTTALTIESSANTGYIEANELNPFNSSDNTKKAGNVWSRVGGLVGSVNEYAYAVIRSSYNTGDVRGYGSIAGGLVGILGGLADGKKPHQTITYNPSKIYYSYNTGTVSVGMYDASTGFGYGMIMIGLSYVNFNGTDVGGLVGVAVNVDINYCYNLGTVKGYGGVGDLFSWQTRQGGIVGEVATDSSNITIDVDIKNSYNAGYVQILEANDSEGKFSADIVGFIDSADMGDKVYVENCYGVANNIQNYVSKKIKYYTGWNTTENGDSGKIRAGTSLATVADLTAVMTSNGTLRPTSVNTAGTAVSLWSASVQALNDDAAYENGTAAGYVYVYGCLPQLSVFAVDTYNGLSMRSKVFGKNIYGEYEEDAHEAGSQSSPYVVKDGIDLLGVSALSNLGYPFDGKYIEVANGKNNITTDKSLSAVTAKTIKLPLDSVTSGTYSLESSEMYKSSSAYGAKCTQTGKSYHLLTNGAIGRDNPQNTDSTATAYVKWLNRNYGYDGDSGSSITDVTFARRNFITIGASNVFEGSFSGKQGESDNTQILDLRVLGYDKNKVYAGLFGRVEGAYVGYVSVTGRVEAYITDNGGTSIVGSIAASVGGKSVIDHCNAGVGDKLYNSASTHEIVLYSCGKAKTHTPVGNLNTYTGGIAGEINTAIGTNYIAGTTSTIKNCVIVDARINSKRSRTGGIVGYASNNADAKIGNNKIYVSDNRVERATIQTISNRDNSSAKTLGKHIGGIIGYSNDNTTLFISGCEVGTDTNPLTYDSSAATIAEMTSVAYNSEIGAAQKQVLITGETCIGGIAGIMPNSINEIVDCSVNKSTLIARDDEWGTIENDPNYGTAIGGIVGFTTHNDTVNAVTTTFSGRIVFDGTILIAKGMDTDNGDVTNVGGVVGDMGAGASIASGAIINVTGNIVIDDSIDRIKNLGGVAGRTRGVAFSGRLTVNPTITAINADNMGGFIGTNESTVDILSDNTVISIGCVLSGKSEVGGFIGLNAAGATLNMGANDYSGVTYEKRLSITIETGANIEASEDNVGGIVGKNEGAETQDGTDGIVNIVKGTFVNNGDLNGRNNVGGIVGLNDGEMFTGGGTGSEEVRRLTITNEGNVRGNNYIGGSIGKLNKGSIAGEFTNNGSVTGVNFVGGSIGYVAKTASVTVPTDNPVPTVFVNSGNVTSTGAYIGGSIGILLGSIAGYDNNSKVEFTNSGRVTATGYVGGSIGVLAGSMTYAQFISSASNMQVAAVNAVGGSVGIIGVPEPLKSDSDNIPLDGTALDVSISIRNTHFEAGGTLTANPDSAAIENAKNADETKWGGIGGAIGVIGDSSNGFNGGSDWSNNTYYAVGNVTANGVYNVGGIVGLIKASGISINNMLAYNTTVTGAKNVGGIVGYAYGSNIEIKSAFAIEGNFVATVSDVGGIVGKANSTTDATTSYWVKGYENAVIAGSNVNNLQQTLGKYEVISETYTNNGNAETITFTQALCGTDKDVSGAIYSTPTEYYKAVGEHRVGGVTVSESDVTDLTWAMYFAKYHSGSSFTNGAWVKPLNNPTYSTGANDGSTGWYFVYANDNMSASSVSDTSIGKVNAEHTDARGNNIASSVYWKRIANAYSASEREAGKDTETLYSTIVQDGGSPQSSVLYATAMAAGKNSGYYMYIESSGSQKPSAIKDESVTTGLFYISIATINSADSAKIAKNVAVYYRTIAKGSALTYNSYERYAPIGLTDAENKSIEFRQNVVANESYADTYCYKAVDGSDTVLSATKPGNYKSAIEVYYYDRNGNPSVVGGIVVDWTISYRGLEAVADDVAGEYGKDECQATLTISNIAPKDKSNITFDVAIKTFEGSNIANATDLVTFKWNGSSCEAVKGADTYGIEIVSAQMQVYSNLADLGSTKETISDSNTYKLVVGIKFVNAKNYLIVPELTNKKDCYTELDKMCKVIVTPATLRIKLGAGYDNQSAIFDNSLYSRSWVVDGIVTKEGYNDTMAVLAAFSPRFVAQIKNSNNDNDYALSSFDLFDTNGILGTSSAVECNSALSGNRVSNVSVRTSINSHSFDVSGMRLVGNYYLTFASGQQGNYKLDTSVSPKFSISNNAITLSWTKQDSSGSHVYDGQKTGKLIATFEVLTDTGISDFVAFLKKYYSATLNNVKADNFVSVNSKKATCTFTTAVDAKTYTAKLELTDWAKDNLIDCSAESSEAQYIITKRPLSVTFADHKGATLNASGKTYVYNTEHQGLSQFTVSGLVANDKVEIVCGGKTYSVTSSSPSATVTTQTVDYKDGGYSVTASMGSGARSSNYKLNGTYTAKWTIAKKALTLSGLKDGSAIYDAKSHTPSIDLSDNGSNIAQNADGSFNFGRDMIFVNYKVNDKSEATAFVNAGEYVVSISSKAFEARRNGVDVSNNYDVTGTGSATFTISAREISLTWTSSPSSFVYYYGRYAGFTVSGASYKVSALSSPVVTSSTVDSATIHALGNDVLTLTLSGKQTNVGKDYFMSVVSFSISPATNEGVATSKDNYIIGNTTSSKYEIEQSTITVSYSSGNVVGKVYDSTTSATTALANSNSVYSVTSTNQGSAPSISSFNVTAYYDDANVASGKAVFINYEFVGDTTNYKYVGSGVQQVDGIGEITHAMLTITLDKLRYGKATRAYNGGTSYGGSGAKHTEGKTAKSQIYTSGEGFSVSGFYGTDDVTVYANYVEADSTRSQRYKLDKYVNNVCVDSEGNYYVGSGYYKKLEFRISGNEAGNYKFVVAEHSNDVGVYLNGSCTPVTVYDKNDRANNEGLTSEVVIEITVKSVRVEYAHQYQSYATADNKYNTEWENISGTSKDIVERTVSVIVANGWQLDGNGEPAVYKGHKVIYGSENSSVLGAKVSPDMGMNFNYRLSNQPILTIGYFVETGDVFEINSLAKLIIASFYWTASQDGDNPEFTQIIKSDFTFELLATQAQYTNNIGMPDGYSDWDGYFEELQNDSNGKIVVFRNENSEVGEVGCWGYYKENPASSKRMFSAFKQTADISGVMTQADEDMLNSFFTVIGQDGTAHRYGWGSSSGASYVKHVTSSGVGNIVSVKGSLFKLTSELFNGSYDGNGYVIDKLKIVGYGSENVGLFDVLGANVKVSNLHLRNFTVLSGAGNTGGIAGSALASANGDAVSNVTFHGSITVSATANVGGLFGSSERSIANAIVLGTITVRGNGSNVGGFVGSANNIKLSNAVSMMQIDATGNVNPFGVGLASASIDNSFHMENAVWKRSDSGLAFVNDSARKKSYAELYLGSNSGYADSDYCKGDDGNKGVFDVVNDMDLRDIAEDLRSSVKARRSMRLRDIIDVDLLMYSLGETSVTTGELKGLSVYTLGNESWIVGKKHGTSDSDAIVIANQQNVSLLRELRFATFTLACDVKMYSSYVHSTYSGAFYGTVKANGHTIDLNGADKMFEVSVNAIPLA